MYKNNKRKNSLNANNLILNGMIKRRRLSSVAISKITDNKTAIRVIK